MSKRNVLAAVGLAVLAAAAGAALFWPADAPPEVMPIAATPEQVAQGAPLYAQYCARCHGADLEGQPSWRERNAAGRLPAPPHDASGHTWHHPDEQLFAVTKHGTEAIVGGDYRSDMIGFADVLSDAEIRAVLAFIKSRWPVEIRERQAEIDERARNAK
jgi:mono/diheme cytochrome c family protein